MPEGTGKRAKGRGHIIIEKKLTTTRKTTGIGQRAES
jgi:hypothetical protein